MGDTTHNGIDEEALRKHIEAIIQRIEEEEDPHELNEYRRLFKKYVPFFRRGYFAGYIVKHGLLSESGTESRGSSSRSQKDASRKEKGRRGEKRRRSASREESQESVTAQDQTESQPANNGNEGSTSDLTSVFVGIGKNRRVYPKDLIQLFSEIQGVEQDDLGQIKILDNYSFVEVNPEKAAAAIDQLNGSEYRGRKITVNFARRKD